MQARTTESAYRRFGLDAAYDEQGGHPDRYPPDWGGRCVAVWERQRDTCGRCGRTRGTVGRMHVHHIEFLSEGGSHRLTNLAGLCIDCHSLMHPGNDELDGDWSAAPVLPAPDAIAEVATVRWPRTDAEKREYMDYVKPLHRLDVTTPDKNAMSTNGRTPDIGSSTARRLSEAPKAVMARFGLDVPDGKRRLVLDYRYERDVTFPPGLQGTVTADDGASESIHPLEDGTEVVDLPRTVKQAHIGIDHPEVATVSQPVLFDEYRTRSVMPVDIKGTDPGILYRFKQNEGDVLFGGEMMDYYRSQGRGGVAAMKMCGLALGSMGLLVLVFAGPVFALAYFACGSCAWTSWPTRIPPEQLLVGAVGLFVYAFLFGVVDGWYHD
jgi:hypothetical protein